ncbi:MAG: tRNA (adenosine(37)-N6)-threonylcarbamoyltransferase complex ATPase subunit type 1 TsaE [Candidatus Omnitrophica bacterium]|nr:tRNA (adenosine(37)-N6)-threonylcarbamoyltransferase complex ATPase subunit type 1 TsaE [Candidatus Omnitrophota bacterium]
MMPKQCISKDANETISLGEKMAKQLKPGDVLCLTGDLGSGKTTFVKGLARGLKLGEELVHSPTFTLMNVYEGKGKKSLFHFDLYRVEKITEIFSLDYEEYLYGDGISVVEWAEKLGKLMPKTYWEIEFVHKGEQKRFITIQKRQK